MAIFLLGTGDVGLRIDPAQIVLGDTADHLAGNRLEFIRMFSWIFGTDNIGVEPMDVMMMRQPFAPLFVPNCVFNIHRDSLHNGLEHLYFGAQILQRAIAVIGLAGGAILAPQKYQPIAHLPPALLW